MTESVSSAPQGHDRSDPAAQDLGHAAPDASSAQADGASTLGPRRMRRAANGRRRWFGADETQSLAFYGEYYR